MKKLIKVGYLVSIILVLAGIFYFFASNWPIFSRNEKFVLSVGSMLIFYSLSVITASLLSHQPFLSKWFITAGAVSFGLSVALIGQIYNSHADSYLLFAVWLVPTLLLAIVTKYSPLAILSYVLFHAAYWFYMNPSSYTIVRTNFEEWVIYLLITTTNIAIFGCTFTRLIPFRSIRYLSYTAIHFMLIGMSIFELYEPYSGWTNVVYILVIISSYLYLKHRQVDKYLSIILFAMGSLYVCTKIIELPFLFGDALGILGLQIFGSILSIGLIVGGIFFASKVTKKHVNDTLGEVLKGTLIVIVTLIGSVMFASCVGGLLFLIFQSMYPSVFLSLLFIVIGLTVNRLNSYTRNTLIMIGFFTGVFEAFFLSIWVTFLFIVISIGVTIMIKDGVIRFISYGTVLCCTMNLLLDHFRLDQQFDVILLILAAINALTAFLVSKYQDLQRISIFFALLFFYLPGFLDHEILFEIIWSTFFFLITTTVFFYFAKKEETFLYRMMLFFWLAFLVSSYYDYIWSLIHKSLSLLLLGGIFFIATCLSDRRTNSSSISTTKLFTKKQWMIIVLIVLIQLGFLGYQACTNEALLQDGKEITLELAPADPRSMLQGDYVRLRYVIGHGELKNVSSGDRVYVLVKKDNAGVYQREKVFTSIDTKSYQLEKDEVLLAGKYNGYDDIIFGIESYFVPEGTGLDLQQTVTHAKVIVSKNGNALLVSIE